MAKVWEKVLGITELGREDNFFEIGGDSLLAMRLVLSLEAMFPGPAIPVSALIPNPTISSMAKFIDQRRQADADQGDADQANPYQPLLTRLGDAEGLIRVVYLHAAGGGGMFYHHLHEGLESPSDTVVLESAALHSEGQAISTRDSIVEMAKDYVDCIVEAGCKKQLTLVGYSFGGLLAFEMAHQLKKRGFGIGQLINIDAPNPKAKIERSNWSRLMQRLKMPATAGEPFAYLKGMLLRKWQAASVRRRNKSGLPLPRALRPLALELAFIQLANRYEPVPCDVPMHLICGEDPEPTYSIDSDYGWTSNVSHLTVTQIPGSHATIFDEPFLYDLKKVIHELLSR